MNTRVLVADDHPVVRQGLKSLLTREGFSVVGEAADGREALRQVEALHPEVALLDLGMPGLNGLDAAREIIQSSAGTKVVILTQHTEEPYILEALRAGVHGYVLKSQSVSDVVQAIRDVTRGKLWAYSDPRRRVTPVPYVTVAPGSPPARILSRGLKRVTLRGKCHYFP